jgi:hypothetical protein
MRKIFTPLSFIFVAIFFTTVSSAQITLNFHPNASAGKDATITSLNPTNNYGTDPDYAAIAWTNGGTSFTERGLLAFDLSSIPQNATITSATLSLYCNTQSSNTQLSSGSNAALIQRITSTWNENTVTWNNQPSSTTQNQCVLSPSTSSTQDYTNIDVKNLIGDMVNNPSISFGFMLQLQTESIYRSLVMSSSDHPDSTKWPRLVITYTPPPCPNSITLRPNAVSGKDAYIESYNTTINYGTSANFAAIAWTGGGHSFVSRSLIDFNLSTIPAGATINNAYLSLYCNTTSDHTELNSGSNASFIQRITYAWDENTVTWNNQPSTTPVNEVTLPQSISQTQDYPNINVTQLISDIRNNPSTSFGMMIQLQTEAVYRSMIFASSDHSDSTKWPMLKVCYTPLGTGIQEVNNDVNHFVSVYPNPAQQVSTLAITLNSPGEVIYRIYTINGQLLQNENKGFMSQGDHQFEVSISQKGVFFIEVEIDGTIYRRKIAIL